MAWTRIDDGFKKNLKIRRAGPDGILLYLYGLIHCNSELTDGFIDEVYLIQLFADAFCVTPEETLEKLVKYGLWIKVKGGYKVNDFLKYNLSKAQIKQRRDAKIEAGRAGGLASGQSRRKADDEPFDIDDEEAVGEASAEADAIANAQGDGLADDIAGAQAKSNPISHIPYPLVPIPPIKTAAAAFVGGNADVYQAFQDGVGSVTRPIQKALDKAVVTYTKQLVLEAIQEGVEHDAETFAYIEAVLVRWFEQGRDKRPRRRSKAVVDNREAFRQAYLSSKGVTK